MFTQSTETSLTPTQEGRCLGCAECSGACFEILELLTVPPRVLKAKGK